MVEDVICTWMDTKLDPGVLIIVSLNVSEYNSNWRAVVAASLQKPKEPLRKYWIDDFMDDLYILWKCSLTERWYPLFQAGLYRATLPLVWRCRQQATSTEGRASAGLYRWIRIWTRQFMI